MLSVTTDIRDLERSVQGSVLTPGSEQYDAERAAWNLLVDHHPDLIVTPTTADDVVAAVRFAAAEGLPVAVQATGHGPSVPADGAVFINTHNMTSVEIDPAKGTARIGAGARWDSVIELAAPHGLAPLIGSSPHVGVVGYLSGGGLPVLGRRYGFSADYVRSFDLVTADGQLRHVTAEREPDLFWAVRGGKGNFGVVTEIEIDLLPVTRLYGGRMIFPIAQADRVLRTWQAWTNQQSEEMASSVLFLTVPDLPEVPEPMRGYRGVHLRIAFTGSEEEGRRLVQPFRDLGPDLDTVAEMPYRRLGEIHADPEEPSPALDTGALLRDLDESAVERLISLIGPEADPPPGAVEIRHLGGALRHAADPANAIGNRSGAYNLFVAGLVLPGTKARVAQETQDIMTGMEPWDTGKKLPNYLGGSNLAPHQVRTAYRDEDYDRLVAIKTRFDPGNMFRFNHNIPPSPAD